MALETGLEWLEGLGKYAEVRFYELAAARRTDSTYAAFRNAVPYMWELLVLERQLGRQPDDLRFYLSGMAQARLLDALSPEWKARAMLGTAGLEDLLRAAVSREVPDEPERSRAPSGPGSPSSDYPASPIRSINAVNRESPRSGSTTGFTRK